MENNDLSQEDKVSQYLDAILAGSNIKGRGETPEDNELIDLAYQVAEAYTAEDKFAENTASKNIDSKFETLKKTENKTEVPLDTLPESSNKPNKLKAFFNNLTFLHNKKFIAGFSTFIFLFVITGMIGYVYINGKNAPVGDQKRDTIDLRNVELVKTAETENGVKTSGGTFEIKFADNKVKSGQDVASFIKLDPNVNFTAELQEDAQTIVIKPQTDLEAGKEYTVVMDEGMKFEGDVETKYPRTWKFATEPVFAITGVTPKDGSTQVPVDSTIEFEFNYSNIDANEFKKLVSISPNINGTYEVVNRKIVFLPKSLYPYTGYTVTIKKGFKNSDGDVINEDKTFQFATGTQTSEGRYDEKPYFTASPTPIIGSYADNPIIRADSYKLQSHLKADIYTVSKDGIVEFMQKYNEKLGMTVMPSADKLKKIATAEFSDKDPLYYNNILNYSFPGKNNYLVDIYSDEVPYRQQRIVSITDYDILVESGDKKTDMWVYNYGDLKFVKGAKVEVYSKDNGTLKQIVTGNTADGGNLNYETTKGKADLVIGSVNNASFYVSNAQIPDIYYGSYYDDFNDNGPEGYRSFLYTDKAAYKKGDDVNFKYIVRGESDYVFSVPKDTKVKIRAVTDHTIFEKEYSLDEWGSIVDAFTLPKNSGEGEFNIYAQIGDSNEYLARSVRIAEFEKGQFDIEVKTDKSIIKNGMTAEATFSVKTYDGKPYTGTVVVKTYMEDRTVTDWVEGVGEDNPNRAYNQNVYEEHTVQLSQDGIGKLKVTPLVSKHGNSSQHQAYNFTFEVTATGSNNISQSETADILVWEDGKRISDKVENSANIKKDSEVTVDVKSTDPLTGAIQKNIDVKYTVVRQYSYLTQVGEHYDETTKSVVKDYRTTYEKETIIENTVNTGNSGIGQFKFKVTKPGSYYANFSSGEGNNFVDLRSYLAYLYDNSQVAPQDYKYDEGLTMSLSGTEYKVGETFDVSLKSDLKAEGLYLIKRGEVYQWKVIDLSTAKKLSYTLDSRSYPSVSIDVYYPSAGYFKADSKDSKKELLAHANSTVKVADPSRDLNLEISGVKSTYNPGNEVQATVTVTDDTGKPVSAEISLVVTDKAIVDLFGENSEQITTRFQELIRQTAAVSYSRVDSDNPGDGGRGDGGGGYTRADLKDVGYWNGKIVTDSSGKATVKFNMPDNITGWVVTAVGMDKVGRVARTQTETVTTQDFSLNFDLPEYLRSSDTLNADISITNYSADTHKGTLKVTSKECKVTPETTDVTVAASSGKYVKVSLTPGTNATECTFTANFTEDNKLLDGLEKKLTILEGSYFESNTASSKVDSEKTFTFQVTKTADRNRAFLELRNNLIDDSYKQYYEIDLDSSPTLNGALLANVALYENWDKFGMTEKKDSLSKIIEKQLAMLYQKQDKTGGISYFGYDANGIQETAFAAYAAGRLEKNGFTIQHDFKNGLLTYLRNTIFSDQSNYDEKMLALRGIASMSQTEALSKASYFFAHRNDFKDSPWAMVLLGNTLYDLGSVSDAQVIADELVGMSKSGTNYAFWLDNEQKYKDPHTKELISTEGFELYSKIGGDQDFRTNILNWLLVNSSQYSYRFEPRFIASKVVLFGTDYNADPQTVTVLLNDKQVYSGTVNGFQSVELTDLTQGDNKVVVKSEGVFATLNTTLLADPKSEIPDDIKITTEYFDLESGAKLAKVKEGEFVRIRNTIVPSIDGKLLTVRNSLPAGIIVLDGYYTQIDQEKLFKFFNDSVSNKWSNNMVEFNDFTEYQVKKSKVYTYDTLGLAKYSGSFDTGASQAFFAEFTDLSGIEASKTITVE